MRLIEGLGAGSAARVVAGLALCAAAACVRAAPVPPECRAALADRRVALVVPYAAGGGYDQYARALAPVLQRTSGARVSVSNIPAGAGAVGVRTVADGDAANLRLGLFEGSLALPQSRAGETVVSRFVTLGSVASEVPVWTAHPDFVLSAPRDKPLVASVKEVTASIAELGLAAHALGIPLRFATGYKGSGDHMAAVLRREVDLMAISVTTVLKAARGGDLKPVLVVSDRPLDEMPGVPWLAGAGGLVDRTTANRPAAERAEAMRVARQAAEMARAVRAVFVSSKLPADAQRCLAAAVETALFSDEFARAAASVGRPPNPADARATQAALDRMREAAEANRDLIRRLTESATR